jgi:hypothetical protein
MRYAGNEEYTTRNENDKIDNKIFAAYENIYSLGSEP